MHDSSDNDSAAVEPPATAGPDVVLRMRGLRKEFDGVAAVADVDLDVHRGELFALLGGSGCGKSTLLRMLAGLETPTAGRVELDGTDITRIPPHLRPVNMMFQSYALFPHMSVADNVAFGLKQEKRSAEEIRARVDSLLDLVHMRSYASRKPHQLSGGQQQRVALARSLAKNPRLLLLDEPMAALDKKLRMQMQLEIVDIIEEVGVTCVMVTHDQDEAMSMAGRIAIMNAGKIMQIGAPAEVYEYPSCRFSAEFLGSVNLFDGIVTHSDGATVQVTVAVRPEKITVAAEPPPGGFNVAHGCVEDLAYLGSHTVYHVRLDGGAKVLAQDVNMRHVGERRFTWNDPVYLHWQAASGVVLPG
jgi:putrescine transport system ATP-binding protein